MKIDINKKYRTREGDEVTHLHRVPDGAPATYPWRGWVKGGECSWTELGYTWADQSERPLDLIEVREPREWKLWGNPAGAIVTEGPSLLCEQTIRVREIID